MTTQELVSRLLMQGPTHKEVRVKYAGKCYGVERVNSSSDALYIELTEEELNP